MKNLMSLNQIIVLDYALRIVAVTFVIIQVLYTGSSSEDYNTHETIDDIQSALASDLRNWAAEYNCTQSSVTAFLKTLGNHNIERLPLDSRTLLKIPRIVS